MKEEEQCEWLSNILGHQEIYERIADEYGEDVNDFYEGGSLWTFPCLLLRWMFFDPSQS